MKNYKVNFTILITIYNESNNIDKLIAELYKSFSGALDQFEILVVDDGSTDGAINKLENYKKQYSNFDYIHVTRNQGKANSYNQAFPVIKSKYIITIDGDLQDDIFDINSFVTYYYTKNYLNLYFSFSAQLASTGANSASMSKGTIIHFHTSGSSKQVILCAISVT